MKNCTKKVIAYNDLAEHRKLCFVEEKACIFGCNNGVMYKGREQQRIHATQDCQKIPLECDWCHNESTRADWAIHECLAGLIEMVNLEDGESVKLPMHEI